MTLHAPPGLRQDAEQHGIEVTEDTVANVHAAVFRIRAEAEIPRVTPGEGIAIATERLEARIDECGSAVCLVAGGTSTGKSTRVTHGLAEYFGERAVILPIDSYYRGRRYMHEQEAAGNPLNFDHPGALDLDLLAEHVAALRAGNSVATPVYSFRTGEREGTTDVAPAPLILVEGLFALREPALALGDVRLFVDTGPHGRFIRRLLRDVDRTGQEPWEIIRQIAETVEPMHQAFVQSTLAHADLVIANEYDAGVEAVRSGLHEYQLKFRTVPTFETLRRAGAEIVGRTTQHDTFFAAGDRDFRVTDEMLRIRRENAGLLFTYKGPRASGIPGTPRTRPKFEAPIDEETYAALQRMYGREARSISKDRLVYRLPDGTIATIDDVWSLGNEGRVERESGRSLGRYFEVRGTASGIDPVLLGRLGLDSEDGLLESYIELAA